MPNNRFRPARVLFAAIAGTVSVLLVCGAALNSSISLPAISASDPAKITVDYPLEGSVFPPEITPPNFLWHDPTGSGTRWLVEVSFAGSSDTIRVEAGGDRLQVGAIDPEAGPPIELTPEQASTRTWRPDAATWAKIKQLSAKLPATVTISGFAPGDSKVPVSVGKVTISTSADPVGAPIFYRDVPLKTSPTGVNGPIAPLPLSAIPLIKWQIRSIAEAESHTVMGNLHTCVNCH